MDDSIVSILMASYNGELYIEKQVLSIINQTYSNWKLYISDDGSSDSTIKTIRKFAETDSRIEVLFNDSKFHGPYGNFWNLINRIQKENNSSDYFMFADQDDIWLPNKIHLLVEEMKKRELEFPKIPILLYTDMKIIDSDDNGVVHSVNSQFRISMNNPKEIFFAHAYVSGCTTIFNKLLLNEVDFVIDKNVNLYSHDNFFAKVCTLRGKIFFIETPTILYRKHGQNVTNSQTLNNSINSLIKKINISQSARTHALVFRHSLKVIDSLNIDTNDVKSMRKAILDGGISGIKYLKKEKIHRNNFLRDMGLKYILLTKKYKKYL
ncbi:glycosyltransferase family 2 protein [Candidatus Enterococcus murrayae]|uniref:Glycosyltransferase family 2 protein n=1 Tax=Candidatus Enterococcus murrayae TaxID=2815321 RepID=A0ABS3HF21_9ENTE|nr:glycosyltransferase family 2 protein [Enterococcus sp. MJM16]MBO0452041.1 glycosyltransferase family 2 protein [Enterococcus sp. MJM16]